MFKNKKPKPKTIGRNILFGFCRALGACAGTYLVICVLSAFANDKSQYSSSYIKTKVGIAESRENIANKLGSYE